MKSRARTSAALVVILTLACSPLGAIGDLLPPTSTPGGEGPPPGSGPTPTEAGEGGEQGPTEEAIFPQGDIPEPPPQGLFDAMQARIDFGEWSQEEGLIASLQLLAGEAGEEILGDQIPLSIEGTGVISEARRYLRTGGDAAAQAEIERLLSIVVPDVDQILEYSVAAGEARRGSPGLAAPQADELCTDLAKKGFPPGSTAICYLFDEDPLGAWAVRVFYPKEWGEDQTKLDYALSALQAVHDSEFTYRDYGQLKDVDVIFTLLESPAKDLAEVTSKGGVSRCEILVYPAALNDTEPVFMQTVAHEMWHCFQQWNFPSHFNSSWAVQDWWGESSAEYFSNVVYPAVNDEWRRLGAFNTNSAERPLVEMSYENWIFFQFLANHDGDQGILSLIQSMPVTGGTADQAFALAAYPNIETLFHEFGRAYVDTQILDASKGLVPTGYLVVPKKFQVTIGQTDHSVALLNTPPFTLTRWALLFVPKTIFTVVTEQTGSPGIHGARIAPGPANWFPVPSTVGAGCDQTKYYVLLTSTTPAGTSDPYTVTVTADKKDDAVCDQCLIGTWDIDPQSFADYLSAPFTEQPDFFHMGNSLGEWRYVFRKNGNMTGEFSYAVSYALNTPTETGGITTDVLLTMEGDGQALYWTPTVGEVIFNLVYRNFTMEQTVYMNNEEVSSGPLSGPGALTGSGSYSCTPTTLSLAMEGTLEAGLPPIDYHRAP